MPYLKKEFTDRIYERVNTDGELLLEVIREAAGEPRKHERSETTFVCPHCHSGALVVNAKKMVYKCFSCNEVSGKNAINFLMGPGSDLSLPDAIKYVCDRYDVAPEYEDDTPKRRRAQKPKASEVPSKEDPDAGSFCSRMLAESGLTRKDVTATVRMDAGDSSPREVVTFQKGTINDRYELDHSGDDAIILYYDIEGNPCTYTFQSKGQRPVERPYYRVRFQFPEAHKDKNGNAMKYRSPSGSPTFIYYPECIRAAYRKKEALPVLFIQEGEKKA